MYKFLLLLDMWEKDPLLCLRYEHLLSLLSDSDMLLCGTVFEGEDRPAFLGILISAGGPMFGEDSLSSPSHMNCHLISCHCEVWEKSL